MKNITHKVYNNGKIEISIFLFLLLANISLLGQTNTIYIDPEYSGIKNGSIAQPFNSWLDLTWNDGSSYLFKRGSTLKTNYKLRPLANNITIGAYGEGNRPLIISTVPNNEKIFDLGSLKNITISDIEVISANNAQSCFHFMNSIGGTLINCKMQGSEWGVRNINSKGLFRIINCEIFMTGDDGSYNQNLDSIEVSGTHIHNVNQKWFVNKSETYSGGDALQLNNVKHFYIHGNILDHSGTGNKFCFISENSNSGLISSGVILNNTFKRNDKGHCIYLYYDQENVLISGNKFMNAGIAIYSHSVNLKVYNNEFINISNTVFELLRSKKSSARIFNNTFYNVRNLVSSDREPVLFKYNIVYKCNGNLFANNSKIRQNYNCFFQVSRLEKKDLSRRSFRGDPLFNDISKLDFGLKKESPCIGIGAENVNVELMSDTE